MSALALAASAAVIATGTTTDDAPYRIELAGDARRTCVRPRRDGVPGDVDELCATTGTPSADLAVTVADPWLVYGTVDPAAAAVRVVLADRRPRTAALVRAGGQGVFHLPVGGGRVKAVQVLDAGGRVTDGLRVDDGPFRHVSGGPGGRVEAGWALRPADLAPQVCLRAGRLGALVPLACTAARAHRPWWLAHRPVGPRDALGAAVVAGGVGPRARRVRVVLGDGRVLRRRAVRPPGVGGALRVWAARLPAGLPSLRVRRVTVIGAGGRVLAAAAPVRRRTWFQRFCRDNPGAC